MSDNETCPFKGEDKVKHTIWGRRGTVDTVRELANRQKSSKWMVRVRWDDGGWGTDGNANFALVEKAKKGKVRPGECKRIQEDA